MPLVSVIVPVYGTEKYLRTCLDSILNQSLQDIEIIVIDDGSPDNSPQIIDDYASKDTRIIPIHKKNGGVSAARNEGINIAKSEYLFLCDSDDWLELEALEKLLLTINRTEADVVISDHISHRDKETYYVKAFIGSKGFITEDRKEIDLIQSSCLLFGNMVVESDLFDSVGNIGAPWQHLYKREIIVQNNLQYDTKFRGIFDDIMFNLEYYQHVNKVAYCAEPTYNYRLISGSLTKSYKPNLINIYKQAFDSIEDFIKKNSKDNEFETAYAVRSIIYLDRMMGCYFNNSNNPDKDSAKREFYSLMKQSPYSTFVTRLKYKAIKRRKTKLVAFLLKYKLYEVYWRLRCKNRLVIE